MKVEDENVKKIVQKYYKTEGWEYTHWHILYTNKYAKENYAGYLQSALRNNYAKTWIEKQKIAQEKLQNDTIEKYEQQQKEKENIEKITQLKDSFLQKIHQLNHETKKEIKQMAYKNVEPDNVKRENLIKIEYIRFLVEYFEKNGEDFTLVLSGNIDFPFYECVMNA